MGVDTILDDVNAHPRVCNTCFRLRHNEDPIPDRIKRLALRVEWAAAVTEAWAQTQWAETNAPPGDTVAEWREKSRCECGCFSAYVCRWDEADEALDFGTLISYTDHLSKTLDELTIEAWDRGDYRNSNHYRHDRDVLFRCVRHLKSDPDKQFVDRRILAASAEVAVRHAPEINERPRRQSVHSTGRGTVDRDSISTAD